jgi:glycosyltransferase involved in cell wall biosynthesis
MTVSVILPALLPDRRYLRCVSSIRAALYDKTDYEIICVVADRAVFASCESSDMRIIQEKEPGIYNAMNLGLEVSVGTYVYFIGQDDILLPAAADALIQGEMHDADLILANVFWGSSAIYRNYAFRQYLVWRNWCHQGLFYHRLRFLEEVGAFPVQFTAQADHYANIVLTHNTRLTLYSYRRCVAWYASDGFSSQHPDSFFRDQFPRLIYDNFGLISFILVVFRRTLLTLVRAFRKMMR